MSAVRSDTQKQVMAEIVATMQAANAEGKDGWKAVESAFPGIPVSVIAEASLALDYQEEVTWWEGVERTIDGELIRNALGKV